MNLIADDKIKVIWNVPHDRQIVHVESIDNFQHKPMYDFAKRVFDVLASSLALAVLIIPMIIIAIVICVDSPGKPIYTQIRLGKDQKPFKIYKFRTMKLDAEKEGAQWALENDPRSTRIGAALRKNRMDELPQLINIISGDMSIVGPRPERPEFYDLFDTYIVGFRQRTLVKPGLTGHAQVNGGYYLKPEEKIVYDIEYIKSRSVKMDISCFLKTIKVLCSDKNDRIS